MRYGLTIALAVVLVGAMSTVALARQPKAHAGKKHGTAQAQTVGTKGAKRGNKVHVRNHAKRHGRKAAQTQVKA